MKRTYVNHCSETQTLFIMHYVLSSVTGSWNFTDTSYKKIRLKIKLKDLVAMATCHEAEQPGMLQVCARCISVKWLSLSE